MLSASWQQQQQQQQQQRKDQASFAIPPTLQSSSTSHQRNEPPGATDIVTWIGNNNKNFTTTDTMAQASSASESPRTNTCNLTGVKVLLLEIHLEGNLGDEMETTPLLQYLYNCGVHITVVLSEWLETDKRVHPSRTSREHMYIHKILYSSKERQQQHHHQQTSRLFDTTQYHAIIVAPGPWNLCAINTQWLNMNRGGGRGEGEGNHVATNNFDNENTLHQNRKIDVFFGGSVFGGTTASIDRGNDGNSGGGYGDISSLSTMKENICNPTTVLVERFIPNMNLMVVRESATYQHVVSKIQEEQQSNSIFPKKVLLGADLSYSYQPSISALMYWREYYISKGYGGQQVFASERGSIGQVEPMILLFSRGNNFARGVRILRDGGGGSNNREDEIDRRQRERERERQGRRQQKRGGRQRQVGGGEYTGQNSELEGIEYGENDSTSVRLVVKLLNGTKTTLNTSHVIFASSSDIEDSKHFEFLRDEYPHIFRQRHRGSEGGSGIVHRDPLVLCQSVEQLFALVSLADHVYTDRYHPGIVAHMFNVPLTVLSYGSEQMKLNGLAEMAEKYTPQELQALNKNAFDRLHQFLQHRSSNHKTDIL